MNLNGTLFFHLNLSYSSIEEEDRAKVIERCYRPLLGLLDEVPDLVMAVEASASTLAAARALDAEWFGRLAAAVRDGRVELVGSGDTQLIGPLVPARVHRMNQRLGRDGVGELIGTRPTTALVNEMAWSQGLVDGYLDAGYDTLLMEWNNARRNHPEWEDEWRYGLSWTASPGGRRVRLAWIDAIAFQKFQRAVVGDLEFGEYLEWLHELRGELPRHVFLYASDAEVFDHRPGRFAAEPAINGDGEWTRMAELLRAIAAADVRFTTPRELREDPAFEPRGNVRLASWADPVPVKKQPKYNVTRWALSGRDDVGLNSRCFAEARRLDERDPDGRDAEAWRGLCRAWASDHRTHLTEARFERALATLPPEAEGVPEPAGVTLTTAEVARDGRRLCVTTDGIDLELDLRRGLAIRSLAFATAGDGSLLGTLPHGFFDDIHWAADFYSGHTVVEIPARSRVTDLERVTPEVDRRADRITVHAEVPTALGPFAKRVTAFADRVRLEYDLSRWGERPLGSVRTGIVTLAPDAFGSSLGVTTALGGPRERFEVEGACDHGRGVSALVTASAAFGATDGRLTLDDGAKALELSWDPARAAALPLLAVHAIDGRKMIRVLFSLSEVDDTHRPGAKQRDFALELAARRLAP